MKYKLVIFDWDGTLMDSVARIVSCMEETAKQLQLPVPSPSAVRNIIGLSLYKALPLLFDGLTEPDIEQLLLTYRRHYLELNTTPTPLFAGTTDVIHGLHSKGYQLAVATGKQRAGLDIALAESKLTPYFHALRGADQALSKPDPLMLKQILAQLQLTPAQAVMVGDSSYDLAMAQAMGMDSVGVTYGVHSSDVLTAFSPKAIIDDIRHLPAWL